MTLVNRVSLFFLTALGIVLIVYSGLFYAFVRGRLVRQFEQELQGALNSLVAAVEVEPEEVKWQPLEHTIAVGPGHGPDQVRWTVIGDEGQVVEHSRNAVHEFVARAQEIAAHATDDPREHAFTEANWHFLYKRLAAPAPERSQRELDEFDSIVVVVSHSAAPLSAEINRLLALVCGLALLSWLAAAVAGHWFCRRAIRPVLDMAEAARAMTGTDLHSRLPVKATNDELSDLAGAFNTLLDRQHRAFEQQRRFAGDAAHELRTPLTVLLGHIDVSLRRPRSAEAYAETLRVLHDQSTELQKVVEALLFLARTDEDAVLPDATNVSLTEWLPKYLQRWNEHPRRADIDLRVSPEPPCRITASTPLLTRLLDNLVENAMKYSRAGTPVNISLTADQGDAVIAVEDHGTGIAEEDQPSIFDPFFRTRAARGTGVAGTGLGLAIAARIAAVFGGRLTCASRLDHGTCFTLTLPLV